MRNCHGFAVGILAIHGEEDVRLAVSALCHLLVAQGDEWINCGGAARRKITSRKRGESENCRNDPVGQRVARTNAFAALEVRRMAL